LIGELVKGKSVVEAFNFASYEVSEKTRICCCYHDHHPKCPWKSYIKDNGLTEEEGHNLHITACDKACEEKQKHDEGCLERREKLDPR
jgi:hypothetical protein